MTMNKVKRKKLERQGWKVGSASEFLGLAAEEARFIELKLTLSRWLREQRVARKLTQMELSQRLKTSQSRVAKMEAGDPTVSLDLLIRSLFALGATKRDLARVIAAARPPHVGHAHAKAA
jgi:ribosome-binding protein aMBF1 (putative translation factor)